MTRRPSMGPGDTGAAFYARPGSRLGDWWTLLHPPYTAWHLSYVAIGACLAPTFRPTRLGATLAAFFLAVGLAAHALDELQGRPLRTGIARTTLGVVAAVGLAGAVAVGIVGITLIGWGVAGFIIVGVVLVVAYNLEWFGGRVHTDAWFAASWGAFPVLTGYYAQAEQLDLVAVVAAGAAFALTDAQRALSTPVRHLRRHVTRFEATIAHDDGTVDQVGREVVTAPIERALRNMSTGLVVLALAMVVARLAGA